MACCPLPLPPARTSQPPPLCVTAWCSGAIRSRHPQAHQAQLRKGAQISPSHPSTVAAAADTCAGNIRVCQQRASPNRQRPHPSFSLKLPSPPRSHNPQLPSSPKSTRNTPTRTASCTSHTTARTPSAARYRPPTKFTTANQRRSLTRQGSQRCCVGVYHMCNL